MPGRVDAWAAAWGDAPALVMDGRTLSYAALATRVNQAARWAVAVGVQKGQVVAIVLPTGLDYLPLWLGITRVGGVAALLNPALSPVALQHGLDAVRPLVVLEQWPALDGFAGAPLAEPAPALADRALHLFTSGTTGTPKAANLTHGRIMEWALWFAGLMDAQPTDRMYDPLPLYHSVGGIVAVGAMLARGGSVLLRDRFSTTRFWDDVVAGECTILAYIGELCRYLLAAPDHPLQGAHHLRLACGNGMQGSVWTGFQARFAIPRILEFYAATEGSLSLYNVDGKPGAIGRIPGYLSHRFPVELLVLNEDEPLRDGAGRCVLAGPDEPGEAVSRLTGTPDLYTDPAATERKLLRDVRAPGDVWFRSGDLMRRDRAGHFYFLDRLGDTFRWKGENVATTDVQSVLGGCPGVRAVVAYGVLVPGQEGRVGMAALVTGPDFSLPTVHARVMAELPPHARPAFLRLSPSLEQTGTFKPLKAAYQAEGWADVPCYVRTGQGYVPLTPALETEILAGSLRL